MGKYRHIVEVEAVQFWPDAMPDGVRQSGRRCTTHDDGEWCDLHDQPHLKPTYRMARGPAGLDMGEDSIQPGDWVVTDWQGMRHAIPDAQFQVTYEPAEPQQEPSPAVSALKLIRDENPADMLAFIWRHGHRMKLRNGYGDEYDNNPASYELEGSYAEDARYNYPARSELRDKLIEVALAAMAATPETEESEHG